MTQASGTPAPLNALRRRTWIWGAALALVVGAVAVGTWLPLDEWVQGLAGFLERLGPWGPVLFALLYAVTTVLLVPGSPLSVAAGAALGLWPAVAAVYAGAVLGSTAALLIARGTARPWVERRLAQHPRLMALDRLLGERGWLVAFLLRLTPVLPYSLLNYALGLTRLSVRHALLASPAMLPGIALYAGVGATLGAAASGRPGSTQRVLVLGIGAVAAVLVSVWLARVARRALPSAGEPPRS